MIIPESVSHCWDAGSVFSRSIFGHFPLKSISSDATNDERVRFSWFSAWLVEPLVAFGIGLKKFFIVWLFEPDDDDDDGDDFLVMISLFFLTVVLCFGVNWYSDFALLSWSNISFVLN